MFQIMSHFSHSLSPEPTAVGAVQFRCRGSRRESAVAQLFSLDDLLYDLCYMNCFRHPTEAAVVFCKGCNKPLCCRCSQQTFGDQTHVCSEDCARTASQSDSEEPRESLFDRVYAVVFLTVLLALLGGGLFVWSAESAVIQEKRYLEREGRPAANTP